MDAPDLRERVREANRRYGMFASGQCVVVAVSGGPDSTALVHVLASLREEWGIRLVVAHLEHGFRGAESEEDAAFVAALCTQLDVPCHIAYVNVPDVRRRLHLSSQEAARRVRHDFLHRVAEENGAERIALGHTQNDRIETVLLNFLRGTGIDGLAAMPPVRLPLVRPFYAVSRSETQSWCALQVLQPRHDSSNDHLDYRRNRLRTELLPYLTTYYNERADAAILRIAELASEDSAYLEECARAKYADVCVERTETAVRLSGEAMAELPIALRRRALRLAVGEVRGSLENITFEVIDTLAQAIVQRTPLQQDLAAYGTTRVRVRIEDACVLIEAVAPLSEPMPWERPLQLPGVTELERCGLQVETALFANGEALEAALQESGISDRSQILVFQCEKVTLPLLARSWRPGDRISVRNLDGRKKLKTLFSDAKIPAAERMRVPVLVEAGGSGRILAVAGLRTERTALSLERREHLADSSRTDRLLMIRITSWLPDS